jgi:hypothetical protein
MTDAGEIAQSYCGAVVMVVFLRRSADGVGCWAHRCPILCLFLEKGSFVRKQFDTALRRRDVFRAALAAVAATATGGMMVQPAAAASTGSADKRKARYQAHSAEVENFYRVNRYPGR